MITNENQLKVTLAKIKDLQIALLQPQPVEIPEVMKKARKAQIQALIQELEAEVEAFKKVQDA